MIMIQRNFRRFQNPSISKDVLTLNERYVVYRCQVTFFLSYCHFVFWLFVILILRDQPIVQDATSNWDGVFFFLFVWPFREFFTTVVSYSPAGATLDHFASFFFFGGFVLVDACLLVQCLATFCWTELGGAAPLLLANQKFADPTSSPCICICIFQITKNLPTPLLPHVRTFRLSFTFG